MPDTNLEIKIRTTADTAGANIAAKSLKAVESESKAGAAAAKNQAKATNEMGESFEKNSQAARTLRRAIEGDVTAFDQLGSVLKAVGQAFKTNPLFTIGSLAATLVLPVIAKISEGWQEQKKKAEEAGRASADAAGAALQAIEKKRENATEKYFHDIAIAADAAKARAEALDLVLVAQVDRKEAVAMASVDANDKLSDREKLTAKLAVSREARAERDRIQLAMLDRNEAEAANLAAKAAAAAATARKNESSSQIVLAGLENQSPNALREQLKQAQADFSAANARSMGGMNIAKAEQARQRIADLEYALSPAAQEAYQTKLKAAQDMLLKATENRVTAEQKAADAASEASNAAITTAARRQVVAILADTKTAVENTALPGQLRRANSQSQAARDEIAAQMDLAQADAINIGARTRGKLGSFPNGVVDEQTLQAAREKAEALATGEATVPEGQSLASELGKLILAVEKIPGSFAQREANNYKAILDLVRQATRRIDTLEAAQKNARTL